MKIRSSREEKQSIGSKARRSQSNLDVTLRQRLSLHLGVLRNAQILPVYLPDWSLRVYVPADSSPPELAVPPRIINKLRLLGASSARVSTGNIMKPRNWRLLIANEPNVDYFLVRNADTRLSEREARAVREWLLVSGRNRSQSAAIVHCIRDHPKHAKHAIVDGLWGGRPRALYQLLRQNITQMVMMHSVSFNVSSSVKSANQDVMQTILNRVLWVAVHKYSFCHDSVSPCDRWSRSTSRRSFFLSRQGHEYVGRKFDAHQDLISEDGKLLKADVTCL